MLLLEIVLIDDATQVRTALYIIGIPLLEHILDLDYEFLLYLLGAENIVGCNACLAAIDKLAPEYALNSCT